MWMSLDFRGEYISYLSTTTLEHFSSNNIFANFTNEKLSKATTWEVFYKTTLMNLKFQQVFIREIHKNVVT